LWLYATSTEVQQAAFSPEMASALAQPAFDGAAPSAPAAGDAQFLLIMDDQERILERLLWTLDNSRMWEPYTFDMSAYIGESVWVHFGVYNDGVGRNDGDVRGRYFADCRRTAAGAGSNRRTTPARWPRSFLLTDAAGHQSVPGGSLQP
jgi:hypothetical protein